MGIGARIKKILKEKNKTIVWLAAESGIPKNTLYTITKRDNTNIRNENIKKIADALGVTTDYLLGIETSNKKTENKPSSEKQDFASVFISSAADAMFKKRALEILNSEQFNKELDEMISEKLGKINIFENESIADTTMELYSTASARDILEPYSKLNESGKEKAVELVSDLAKKKHYQKDPDTKK